MGGQRRNQVALGNSTLTANGGPRCMDTAVHSSPGDLFVVNITMLNIMVTGAPEPGTRRPKKRKFEGQQQGQWRGQWRGQRPDAHEVLDLSLHSLLALHAFLVLRLLCANPLIHSFSASFIVNAFYILVREGKHKVEITGESCLQSNRSKVQNRVGMQTPNQRRQARPTAKCFLLGVGGGGRWRAEG